MFVGGRTSILPQTNKMYRKIEHLFRSNIEMLVTQSYSFLTSYELSNIRFHLLDRMRNAWHRAIGVRWKCNDK